MKKAIDNAIENKYKVDQAKGILVKFYFHTDTDINSNIVKAMNILSNYIDIYEKEDIFIIFGVKTSNNISLKYMQISIIFTGLPSMK
jgi:cell division GTPase FtsZ